MEIRARYVLIGLFVVAVIVGGFGFVYWLNNSQGLAVRTTYRVAFDGSVAGLSAGSDVLFNGLRVGEVTRLDLVADQPGRVIATVSVDGRAPIRADTRVGLGFSGLTGAASVALTGGTATAALPPASDGGPPLLVADPAAMKDVTQSARDALVHFDALLTDNSKTITDAIANIDSFSAALARNSGKVDTILGGLEKLTGTKTEATPTTYELAPPTDFPAIAAIPSAQLALPAPTAVILLDTPRILVQTDAGEAPAFPDARWADNIPVLLQSRIVQGFENAHYLKVGPDSGSLTADYKLVLDIRRFRISTSPAAAAEIAFSAKLLGGDGKVVDARIFSASSPVTATNDAAVAAKGLDAAFGKAATDLIVWTIGAIDENATAAAKAPAP